MDADDKLDEGANTIELNVTDTKGNSSIDTLTISYDKTKPTIQSIFIDDINAIDNQEIPRLLKNIKVAFNENIKDTTSSNVAFENNGTNLISLGNGAVSDKILTLTIPSVLEVDVNYTLTIKNVEDKAGNKIESPYVIHFYVPDSRFVGKTIGVDHVVFQENIDNPVAPKNRMWEDNKTAPKLTLEEAKDYCKNLSYAGKNDWELPTLEGELTSIVDKTRAPTIDKAFLYAKKDSYWTRKSFNNAGAFYILRFQDGKSSLGFPTDKHYVRCVRENN